MASGRCESAGGKRPVAQKPLRLTGARYLTALGLSCRGYAGYSLNAVAPARRWLLLTQTCPTRWRRAARRCDFTQWIPGGDFDDSPDDLGA